MQIPVREKKEMVHTESHLSRVSLPVSALQLVYCNVEHCSLSFLLQWI